MRAVRDVASSMVIQDVETMCKTRNVSMAYFYFDFRDVNKQDLCDLLVVSSLLTQLSARSSPHCDILSDLYFALEEGKNRAHAAPKVHKVWKKPFPK